MLFLVERYSSVSGSKIENCHVSQQTWYFRIQAFTAFSSNGPD
jgi:hypothetical protein